MDRLHFALTREQDPEILELLRLRQQLKLTQRASIVLQGESVFSRYKIVPVTLQVGVSTQSVITVAMSQLHV